MFGLKKMKNIIFFRFKLKILSFFDVFWRFCSKPWGTPGELKKPDFLEGKNQYENRHNFKKFYKMGGGGSRYAKYLGFL